MSLRISHLSIGFLCLVSMLLGCSQTEPNIQARPAIRHRKAPPVSESFLRVIYAGSHRGLSVRVNGVTQQHLDEGKQDTGFFKVESGKWALHLHDDEKQAVLVDQSATFAKDVRYTLYVVPTSEGLIAQLEASPFHTAVDTPLLRILHATSGMKEIDVWSTRDAATSKDQMVVEQLRFRELTKFLSVPSAGAPFEITFSGREQTLLRIKPNSFDVGRRYTLILAGAFKATDTEALRTYLFSEDIKTPRALQIATQTRVFLDARVRVHHTATLGNRTVKVLLDGREFLSRLKPGYQSPLFSVPLGQSRLKVLDVKAQEVLLEQNVSFEKNGRYSLYLVQVEPEFATAEQYKLQLVTEDSFAPELSPSVAKVRWFHAVKDYQKVSARLQGNKTKILASDVGFQQCGEVLSVEPGLYPVTMVIPDLRGMEVTFAPVNLKAGTLTTLIVTQTSTGRPLRHTDTAGQHLTLQVHQHTTEGGSIAQSQATRVRYISYLSFVQASSVFQLQSSALRVWVDGKWVKNLSRDERHTGYFTTMSGQQVVRIGDAITDKDLFQQEVKLEKNQSYTAYLHDDANNQPSLWFLRDIRPALQPDQAMVRLIHLAPRAGKLDLTITDPRPMVIEKSVAYQQSNAFNATPSGSLTLILRNSSQLALWQEKLMLQPGRAYTVLVNHPSPDAGTNIQVSVVLHELE